MVQRLKPDSNPKPPPEHCANCCTAVSPILYYPFLFSLLTDLKDGHDGCRKGIKVCWCVVLKDEPVTKTKWTKRWEKIVNHCFILFSGPISLFRGHGRSCSVLSVFQRAGLCTQLHCTHFFKVTVSLTLFSSIKTNSRFDLFGWMEIRECLMFYWLKEGKALSECVLPATKELHAKQRKDDNEEEEEEDEGDDGLHGVHQGDDQVSQRCPIP